MNIFILLKKEHNNQLVIVWGRIYYHEDLMDKTKQLFEVTMIMASQRYRIFPGYVYPVF